MKIALTHMNPVWEEKEENKKICERLVEQAHAKACDYVVFPELTLTGFTMQPEQFVASDDREFFAALSKKYEIAIVFGYIGKGNIGKGNVEKGNSKKGNIEKGNAEDETIANGDAEHKNIGYHNRLAIADKGKIIFDYAKIHPFSYGDESKHYVGGDTIFYQNISGDGMPGASSLSGKNSLSGQGLVLSGFICYDLRFPEIFQKASRCASLIFVIANWPAARVDQWKLLLQARALENQAFIIGVNRSGEGGGLTYVDSSYAVSPHGTFMELQSHIFSEGENGELLIADLDIREAEQYRREFPVKEDRREYDQMKCISYQ